LYKYFAEPLAADYRELKGASFWQKRERFREAKLAVLATLFNTDKETLARREQQRRARRLIVATATILTLTIIFTAIAYIALRNARNTSNEKARNYWEISRADLKNGRSSKALHSMASAIDIAQDKRLISNLMLAASAIMPEARLKHIFLHGSNVTGASFNRDGTRILSSSEDGTAQLWDALNGTPIGPQLRCQDAVKGVVFNQDETGILTWSSDKTARVWDAATGKQILLIEHQAPVMEAVFSHDGTRILSRDFDGNVQLRDMAKGTSNRFDFKPADWGAIFNYDETKILTWGNGGARVWRASDGTPISPFLKLNADDSLVVDARFNHDETRILGCSQDGTINIWDAASGRVISKFPGARGELWLNHHGTLLLTDQSDNLHLNDTSSGAKTDQWTPDSSQGSFDEATFNQDDTRILAWGDKRAMVLSASSGKSIGVPLGHEDSVIGATFNHGETSVLTWSSDGTARLWDTSTWESFQPLQHADMISGGIFSNNDSQVLTWSADGTLKLWDIARARPRNLALAHDTKVLGAKINSLGNEILTWSYDGTMYLWDAVKGDLAVSMKGLPSVLGASFGPDERQILGWGRQGIWLFDREKKETLWSVETNRVVEGAVFNKDGTRILAWDNDGVLLLFDASNGSGVLKLQEGSGRIRGAIFSQDEMRILVWGDRSDVRLWDIADKKVLWSIKHDRTITHAIFNKDETRVLTWGEDGIQLSDAANGKTLIPLLKHQGSAWGTRFSPDEKHILSWGDDGIRLWDAETGQQLGDLMKQESPIIRASFNQNETQVLSWNEDGETQLWDIRDRSKPLLEIVSEIRGRYSSGAKFNGDETIIFTWNGSGMLLLDANNGEQIGPRLTMASGMKGFEFNKDDTLIVTWGDDPIARVWNVAGDLDFPKDHFKLQVAALTGAEIDLASGHPKAIEPERWQKYLREYLAVAEQHYKSCRYAHQNILRWFF
jgi:WD40 repeat protein